MDPILLCDACMSVAVQDETGKFICVSMSCPNRRHPAPSTLPARAQALIQAGYQQTSRNHCMVARVPEWDSLPEKHQRVLCEFGTSYYLRVYSMDKLTLEPELFEEFRRQGGRAA